jgi:hypothetical protein
MNLASAASYFDDVLCVDPFNPHIRFRGQLDLFDDSKRDGATVDRRVLSVAPAVLMPARRVLTIHGDKWLIGDKADDSFRGSVIRSKYIIHKAQGPCTIGTPAQILSTGGVSSYGAKIWIKDAKLLEISSKLTSFFNIYLAPVEEASAGMVVQLTGRLHLIRNSFLSAAGFLVAEGDELEQAAIQPATLYARGYDPVTEARAEAAPLALNVLRFRFQDNYAYTSESAEKFAAGDIRAMIAKSAATPKVGDRLTLADGDWYPVSVASEGTSWNLHLRRKQ